MYAGSPPPSHPQQPPATLHIHHCGVRPWGALVTMKVNSEIAPRPHCRLFKLWYKPPHYLHLPPPPPYIGCKLQRCVKYIHYTDGRITRRACVRVSTRPCSAHGWTSMGTDQKRIPSFRCRVHRLDYTAAFQCILQEIKLSTHDYSPLWNTLDRDQCDPFFFLRSSKKKHHKHTGSSQIPCVTAERSLKMKCESSVR